VNIPIKHNAVYYRDDGETMVEYEVWSSVGKTRSAINQKYIRCLRGISLDGNETSWMNTLTSLPVSLKDAIRSSVDEWFVRAIGCSLLTDFKANPDWASFLKQPFVVSEPARDREFNDWLRSHGHFRPASNPASTNLSAVAAAAAKLGVPNNPRWDLDRQNRNAVVGKERARRPIWWRRRTPLEAYWDLREAITGRWRPGSTDRNPIPQVEGRKPPKAFVHLARRPFPLPFQRIGWEAGDQIEARWEAKDQIEARRRHLLEHGSCSSRLFTSSGRVGGVVALPYRYLDELASSELVAETRQPRVYTDLSDEVNPRTRKSRFWSSTKLEPKGSNLPLIKTGTAHVRAVIDTINKLRERKKLNREEEAGLVHDYYYHTENLDSRTSLIEDNLTVASVHAKKRAARVGRKINKKEIEERVTYHDLLGDGVKVMLEALEDMKFDPIQGTRLSTFFEQVVGNGIKDSLKKENLYARRHEPCDFRDNEDDYQPGEPIEKTHAVRGVVDGQTATEFAGEENMAAALKDVRQLLETGLSAANRALLMTGFEDDDKTYEEIGAKFGRSGNAVQKRISWSLDKLKHKMNKS
jgi:DNA-directed RNA polymerase specialized sigma24 family protein